MWYLDASRSRTSGRKEWKGGETRNPVASFFLAALLQPPSMMQSPLFLSPFSHPLSPPPLFAFSTSTPLTTQAPRHLDRRRQAPRRPEPRRRRLGPPQARPRRHRPARPHRRLARLRDAVRALPPRAHRVRPAGVVPARGQRRRVVLREAVFSRRSGPDADVGAEETAWPPFAAQGRVEEVGGEEEERRHEGHEGQQQELRKRRRPKPRQQQQQPGLRPIHGQRRDERQGRQRRQRLLEGQRRHGRPDGRRGRRTDDFTGAGRGPLAS